MSAEEDAVRLIAGIARTSPMRSEDGIAFWNGYLRSRVDRHVHRSLREFASRVSDECRCDTSRFFEYAEEVCLMEKSHSDMVSSVIRRQTGLTIAMAFADIRNARKGMD
jgi:hypothetical protein